MCFPTPTLYVCMHAWCIWRYWHWIGLCMWVPQFNSHFTSVTIHPSWDDEVHIVTTEWSISLNPFLSLAFNFMTYVQGVPWHHTHAFMCIYHLHTCTYSMCERLEPRLYVHVHASIICIFTCTCTYWAMQTYAKQRAVMHMIWWKFISEGVLRTITENTGLDLAALPVHIYNPPQWFIHRKPRPPATNMPPIHEKVELPCLCDKTPDRLASSE